MKHLFLILAFVCPLLINGQHLQFSGYCPDESIEYNFVGDTLILTITSYEQVWGINGFHYSWECEKKVRKEIYKAEHINTIHAKVTPEKTIPEKIEFTESYPISNQDAWLGGDSINILYPKEFKPFIINGQ